MTKPYRKPARLTNTFWDNDCEEQQDRLNRRRRAFRRDIQALGLFFSGYNAATGDVPGVGSQRVFKRVVETRSGNKRKVERPKFTKEELAELDDLLALL